MRYTIIPGEIQSKDIEKNNYMLSSQRYRKVDIQNPNVLTVREFLSRDLKNSDLGSEIGSINYVFESPFYFIRTKALQPHTFLPEINTETVVPMIPKAFIQKGLKEGDVLISKDSNIGEVVILDKDYPNYMVSGAIYRLPISKMKYYLLAFLKHDIFREQLDLLVPKGATIRHAKTLFLDCKIPVPRVNKEKTILFVEVLMQAVINKEKEIRKKHNIIHRLIMEELNNNQNKDSYSYDYPTLEELRTVGRLDTARYSEGYKAFELLIANYQSGFFNLTDMGYKFSRGQNLQVSAIGKSFYTDKYINGFYNLVLSSNISEYSTLEKLTYIGNRKSLKKIDKGEIIYSCRGAQFGRVIMFPYNIDAVTNIDNMHIRNENAPIHQKIFITMYLNLLRWNKHIYKIALSGSGANSLTKYQFDEINFPNFPEVKQKEIAKYYYNPKAKYSPVEEITVENFLENDKYFNQQAGIADLDFNIKKLHYQLEIVLNKIKNNEKVEVNFDFLNDD